LIELYRNFEAFFSSRRVKPCRVFGPNSADNRRIYGVRRDGKIAVECG
jgi:hypothetical protein